MTPIEYVNDWRTHDDLNIRCRLMKEITRQIISKQVKCETLKQSLNIIIQPEVVLYCCASRIQSYKSIETLERRLANVFKKRLRSMSITGVLLSKRWILRLRS